MRRTGSLRFDFFRLLRFLDLFLDVARRFLELADPLAESLHEFGDALGAEEDEDDERDDEDFRCSEVSEHVLAPFKRIVAVGRDGAGEARDDRLKYALPVAVSKHG